MPSYYETAKDVVITRERAYVELKRHGVENEWSLFLKEVGDCETYSANEVLEWLGY